MTVHVIEDDAGVADSLCLLLRQVGHEVSVYSDGKSFMDRGAVPGDTVILDLDLPDIAGADILRHYTIGPDAVRFIIVTGLSRAMIDREVFEFENVPILRKPMPTMELVRLVGPV